jgi:hypothetical protein
MKNSKKYIAVLSGGVITVHLPHTTGAYATLCCLDGDDDNAAVDQQVVAVPENAKVNCGNCYAIWGVAQSYSWRDFTPGDIA